MKSRDHNQAVLEAVTQDLKDETVKILLDEGYESLEEDGPAGDVQRDRSGLLEPVDFVNRGLPGRESGQHQIQVSPIKSKETD